MAAKDIHNLSRKVGKALKFCFVFVALLERIHRRPQRALPQLVKQLRLAAGPVQNPREPLVEDQKVVARHHRLRWLVVRTLKLPV